MIVNWQNANRVGSVGKPGPGMGVRTDDDGELQVMGPNVFLGVHDKESWRRPLKSKCLMVG